MEEEEEMQQKPLNIELQTEQQKQFNFGKKGPF